MTRVLNLDAGAPLPPELDELAAALEDATHAPDPDLVAKVEALLDSPHAGEREAARAALDRLRSAEKGAS